jgi:hypothetical protein
MKTRNGNKRKTELDHDVETEQSVVASETAQPKSSNLPRGKKAKKDKKAAQKPKAHQNTTSSGGEPNDENLATSSSSLTSTNSAFSDVTSSILSSSMSSSLSSPVQSTSFSSSNAFSSADLSLSPLPTSLSHTFSSINLLSSVSTNSLSSSLPSGLTSTSNTVSSLSSSVRQTNSSKKNLKRNREISEHDNQEQENMTKSKNTGSGTHNEAAIAGLPWEMSLSSSSSTTTQQVSTPARHTNRASSSPFVTPPPHHRSNGVFSSSSSSSLSQPNNIAPVNYNNPQGSGKTSPITIPEPKDRGPIPIKPATEIKPNNVYSDDAVLSLLSAKNGAGGSKTDQEIPSTLSINQLTGEQPEQQPAGTTTSSAPSNAELSNWNPPSYSERSNFIGSALLEAISPSRTTRTTQSSNAASNKEEAPIQNKVPTSSEKNHQPKTSSNRTPPPRANVQSLFTRGRALIGTHVIPLTVNLGRRALAGSWALVSMLTTAAAASIGYGSEVATPFIKNYFAQFDSDKRNVQYSYMAIGVANWTVGILSGLAVFKLLRTEKAFWTMVFGSDSPDTVGSALQRVYGGVKRMIFGPREVQNHLSLVASSQTTNAENNNVITSHTHSSSSTSNAGTKNKGARTSVSTTFSPLGKSTSTLATTSNSSNKAKVTDPVPSPQRPSQDRNDFFPDQDLDLGTGESDDYQATNDTKHNVSNRDGDQNQEMLNRLLSKNMQGTSQGSRTPSIFEGESPTLSSMSANSTSSSSSESTSSMRPIAPPPPPPLAKRKRTEVERLKQQQQPDSSSQEEEGGRWTALVEVSGSLRGGALPSDKEGEVVAAVNKQLKKQDQAVRRSSK